MINALLVEQHERNCDWHMLKPLLSLQNDTKPKGDHSDPITDMKYLTIRLGTSWRWLEFLFSAYQRVYLVLPAEIDVAIDEPTVNFASSSCRKNHNYCSCYVAQHLAIQPIRDLDFRGSSVIADVWWVQRWARGWTSEDNLIQTTILFAVCNKHSRS